MIQRTSDLCEMFSPRLRQIFTVFVLLQILDALTTLVGLRYGATESSIFVAQLLRFGPVTGLMICKGFALCLATTAIAFGRERLVRFVNFWFAGVVGWNVLIILRISASLS